MAYLPLITRLTRQLSAKGVPNPRAEAITQLRAFGLVRSNSEELTNLGKEREAMGPGGRAIDRAAKRSGHAPEDYKYSRGKAKLR